MKIKVIILVVLFSLFICSCIERAKEVTPIAMQWSIGLSDTVVEEIHKDWYLRYKFSGDSTYSIQWGNDTVTNISQRQFKVLGNGVYGVLCATQDYIVLRQSTGTSAASYIWLALQSKAEPYVELAMDEYYFQ